MALFSSKNGTNVNASAAVLCLCSSLWASAEKPRQYNFTLISSSLSSFKCSLYIAEPNKTIYVNKVPSNFKHCAMRFSYLFIFLSQNGITLCREVCAYFRHKHIVCYSYKGTNSTLNKNSQRNAVSLGVISALYCCGSLALLSVFYWRSLVIHYSALPFTQFILIFHFLMYSVPYCVRLIFVFLLAPHENFDI